MTADALNMAHVMQPGVVPVFVNLGPAVLVPMLGAIVSSLALLFKPKELARVIRTKPQVLLIFVGVAAAIALPVTLIGCGGDDTEAAPPAQQGAAPGMQVDWAELAVEWYRQHGMATAGATTRPAAGSGADGGAEGLRATIYRGGPARTGYDGGPVPLNLAPARDYTKRFTLFLTSPTVVGDAVYGASCIQDPPKTYGAVFALDAQTMEERWRVRTADVAGQPDPVELKGIVSSPAVSADGKRVVIGQGLHPDANVHLLCLSSTTGRVLWSVFTELHVEGSPAIAGDLVVAGAGAIEGPNHRAQGHPGYVFAVRLSDGKELWRHELNDPESSPVIHEGVAYIGSGFNGRAVVALRTETDDQLAVQGLKREIWRVETPYPATGAITLVDDLVLVGCGKSDYVVQAADPDGVVMALNRRTGEVVWQAAREQGITDSVLGGIAVKDGVAICPSVNGSVIALDVKTGKKLWSQDGVSEEPGTPILAGCAFTGRYVYAVSKDGYLAVLDAKEDGKVLERHWINDKPGEQGLSISSPYVAHGKVYVGSETGGLRCFAGRETR